MMFNSIIAGFELICVIVKYDLGSRIIKHAKKCGITGGTIVLGKGTIKNSILEFLELSEVRREIVLMVADPIIASRTLKELNGKFNFERPHHGIAFSIPIINVLGAKSLRAINNKESRGVTNPMYNVIFVIVDRGNAENVIDSASKAGSRGGTIINARGSGIHETSKLFSMEIEPEKEIVLIISEAHLTDKIADAVRTALKIDVPGNGIIFIQDINMAYGLYK